MYKTLAVAALAAVASAQQTIFTVPFSWSGNGMTYYYGNIAMTVDAGYNTLYNRHNQNPSQSETYEFNIYSYADLQYHHEVMQTYMSTYDWKLSILDFTPYGQNVTWNRVD